LKNFLPLTPLCANEQDILALGAIFATTDSVAVLQVLDQERSPILFSLVFGEGVLNDAAGVALLRAIQVCCCCAFFMSGMWKQTLAYRVWIIRHILQHWRHRTPISKDVCSKQR